MKRSSTVTEHAYPPLVPTRSGAPPSSATAERASLTSEIERLSELAINGELDGALRFISEVVDDGVPTESALLVLVAPTARFLGDQWIDQTRAFDDVMKGLDLLRQAIEIMRSSSMR